ncbi:MAG TPA: hypothetical protein VGA70_03160, partial [Longimicrobiales bacterium]
MWHIDGSPGASGEAAAVLTGLRRARVDLQAVHDVGSAAVGARTMFTSPEDRIDRQPVMIPDSGAVLVADARLDDRSQLARRL